MPPNKALQLSNGGMHQAQLLSFLDGLARLTARCGNRSQLKAQTVRQAMEDGRVRRTRAQATSIVVLWLVAQAIVFLTVRPDLSHSLSVHENMVPHMPLLTTSVVFPILGGDLAELVESRWLFYVFWISCWAGPITLIVAIQRARTEVAALRRFLFGGATFASTWVLSLMVLALGLWLPFAAH